MILGIVKNPISCTRYLVVIVEVRLSGKGMYLVSEGPHRYRGAHVCLYICLCVCVCVCLNDGSTQTKSNEKELAY